MLAEIRGVSEDMRSMLQSVEKLSGQSEEVDSLLAELARLSESVHSVAAKIDGESTEIARSMAAVKELASRTPEHMADMTKGIGEVSSSLGLLADSGARNSEITRTINTELKRFITGDE